MRHLPPSVRVATGVTNGAAVCANPGRPGVPMTLRRSCQQGHLLPDQRLCQTDRNESLVLSPAGQQGGHGLLLNNGESQLDVHDELAAATLNRKRSLSPGHTIWLCKFDMIWFGAHANNSSSCCCCCCPGSICKCRMGQTGGASQVQLCTSIISLGYTHFFFRGLPVFLHVKQAFQSLPQPPLSASNSFVRRKFIPLPPLWPTTAPKSFLSPIFTCVVLSALPKVAFSHNNLLFWDHQEEEAIERQVN